MNSLTESETFYLTRLLNREIRRKKGEINNAYDQSADPLYPEVTPEYAAGKAKRLEYDIERAESILEKLN